MPTPTSLSSKKKSPPSSGLAVSISSAYITQAVPTGFRLRLHSPHQELTTSHSNKATMPMEQEPPKPHFLVVTFPAQGHINPARRLARRLALAAGARVTISTPVSAYRKMFPSAADDHEHFDGTVGYAPYSDGYDGGCDNDVHDHARYMSRVKLVGPRTLSSVFARLRDGGRPVTCAVYTLLLPWVADVAREHGVPAALYWIQSATALAAYYHYFRGLEKAVAAAAHDPWAAVRVPGLPPLRVRDLPSFLAITSPDDPYAFVLAAFRDLVDALGRGHDGKTTHPPVLANTFDAMEPDALASLKQHIDIVAVGPALSFLDSNGGTDDIDAVHSPNDLFKQDDKRYLEWLGTKPANSVVYISFGSFSVMSKAQIAEIARAMEETGRPFLWVLRKDNRKEGDETAVLDAAGENGMVVEWCDQMKVLSHPSVGCFVTHCGWNSTLEGVASGVPMVGVPQLTDQTTNAWLVEQLGLGVRAMFDEKDRVLEAAELRRCLELVMLEVVRAKAEAWREKARAAVADGQSSDTNLRAFVRRIAEAKCH